MSASSERRPEIHTGNLHVKKSYRPRLLLFIVFNRRSKIPNDEVTDMKLPQRKIRFASIFLFSILAVNFMVAQKPLHTAGGGDETPNGKHGQSGQITAAVPGPVGQAVVTGNGINYHGGPVMKGNPVSTYVIWYGNWSGTGSNTAATRSLIEHFLGTIGGSNIERVNTTYGDTTGNVSGNVRFAGSTIVNSTTNLSDTSLRTTVSNALNSGALPRDAN